MPDNLKRIRKDVAKGLKAAGLTRPCVLFKTTEGAYAVGAASGDTAKTVKPYRARGLVSAYSDNEIDGTLILRSDRKILLLGATITGGVVPVPGDRIQIKDHDGATKTFTIPKDGVGSDPAAATFTCTGRL
jgi:hypothetical protein